MTPGDGRLVMSVVVNTSGIVYLSTELPGEGGAVLLEYVATCIRDGHLKRIGQRDRPVYAITLPPLSAAARTWLLAKGQLPVSCREESPPPKAAAETPPRPGAGRGGGPRRRGPHSSPRSSTSGPPGRA